MKKILFVIPSFMHGGTNRSFCNVIDMFDFKKHNISAEILCIKEHSSGVYKKEFENKGLVILPENKKLSSAFYSGKNLFKKAFMKGFLKLSPKIQNQYFKKAVKKYSDKYDMVVALQEGVASAIASFINAPCRMAWLRCIYEVYYKNNGKTDESYIYDKLDKIICVSEACEKSLIEVYPKFKNKTIVIQNTQNADAIIEKSKEKTDIEFVDDTFNIVSVGRLDKIKQFDKIPEIVNSLKQKGLRISWYIVGDGVEKWAIENKIKEYALENSVHLVGSRNNPYPIIKNADLVAVTSFSESFCNVIAEAEILNTPVISTAFPASYEAMKNKNSGIICELGKFSENIYEMVSNYEKYKPEKDYALNNFYSFEKERFTKKIGDILCQ